MLPEYLLGVRPITPGYGKFVVQPKLGYLGLKEAVGRVPTPFGAINASWCVDGEKATVDVEVPGNVTGALKIPGEWVEEGSKYEAGEAELLPGHHRIVLYKQ